MQLSSNVVVDRDRDAVWSFLADPQNVAKWDRGVKAVEPRPGTPPPGEGFEFTTVGHDSLAPDHGRMDYRITQTDPEAGCRVDLTSQDGNARYFKSAWWSLRVVDQSGSVSRRSRVECAVHFQLRTRYFWLAPILFVMRGAIRRDLLDLKRVLESA